jgi:hypothetical protein
MGQSAKSNGANPPFSNGGKPANQGQGGGGNDFLTKPQGTQTSPKPGEVLLNRPQKPASDNPATTINPQSIPAGGKLPWAAATPGKANRTETGDASAGVAGASKPYKGLK